MIDINIISIIIGLIFAYPLARKHWYEGSEIKQRLNNSEYGESKRKKRR